MIPMELGPEVIRLLFIVSVAIAFGVYTRLHLVGGGSVSGGYIALLAISGQWSTVVGIAVATTVTYVVLRGIILRFLPMPRSIVFTAGVLVSSLTIAGMQWAGVVPELPLPILELLATLGSFVVPGLIAYDIAHQGPLRTALGVTLVAGGTLVAGLVVGSALQSLPSGAEWTVPFEANIPDSALALAAVTVVVAGGVIRFTTGLRSGGFIGALFVADFLTPGSFIAVGLAATATAIVVKWLAARIVLTPRQTSMMALMVGSLVAWASLFWAGVIGWSSAQQAYGFVLAPLLAVGLIASDMVRPDSGVVRTLAGTGLTVIALELVLSVADAWGSAAGWIALAILGLGFLPAVAPLRRRMHAAERTGRNRPRAASSALE